MLYRRAQLVRLFAAVLLGSTGAGLISPVLAAGDIAAWLTVEGIDQEALDVAMTAATDSDSPAEVTRMVALALGEETPAQDAFLHALYGRLYQILQFQQGPLAVTVSSANASPTLELVPYVTVFNRTHLKSRTNSIVLDVVPDDDRVRLPRVKNPAVQPLGP